MNTFRKIVQFVFITATREVHTIKYYKYNKRQTISICDKDTEVSHKESYTNPVSILSKEDILHKFYLLWSLNEINNFILLITGSRWGYKDHSCHVAVWCWCIKQQNFNACFQKSDSSPENDAFLKRALKIRKKKQFFWKKVNLKTRRKCKQFLTPGLGEIHYTRLHSCNHISKFHSK